MKTIITAEVTFGPFREVLVLDDRLQADGVEYQFNVLGEHTVSDDPVVLAPAAPAVPLAVPMRNARLALYAAGLLSEVQSLIDGMEGEFGDLARIDWTTALTVRRDSPLVARLTVDLGKTETEIDALFIQAALLDSAT